MGSKSITKKELAIKSIIYRVYTTVVELILAYVLKLLADIDVIAWVLLINTLKLLSYFAYDLSWFSFLRKPGILKRLKRWIGIEG
jgi:hypothetical protein